MDSQTNGPAEEADVEQGRVVWLFGPGAIGDEETQRCSPAELLARLATAVGLTGLGSVAVTGVVAGLRRHAQWATFKLAEHSGGVGPDLAVVSVVVLASVLAEVDLALAKSGRHLRDGMNASVTGQVCLDVSLGSFRVVGRTLAVLDEGALTKLKEGVVVVRSPGVTELTAPRTRANRPTSRRTASAPGRRGTRGAPR